jgi:hypothetical protein
MNKNRIAILTITFLSNIYLPLMPNWFYSNFWGNAAFWQQLGWRIPFGLFLVIYAVLATLTLEVAIRFIKKYA